MGYHLINSHNDGDDDIHNCAEAPDQQLRQENIAGVHGIKWLLQVIHKCVVNFTELHDNCCNGRGYCDCNHSCDKRKQCFFTDTVHKKQQHGSEEYDNRDGQR